MRTPLVYLLLVGGPLVLLLDILGAGQGLAPGLPGVKGVAAAAAKTTYFLLTLLLQIAVVLVVARMMGELSRRLHQPRVLGEIVHQAPGFP
jgi:preprotein translocase subunit SecG